MIHPIVSIAVFFVDQVTQAPVQVQCVQQTVASPEWKWWMSVLAPWIGPLLSGVVSIYVAWRVFKWQGERDQRRWLLDQKKSEWKEMVESLNICSPFLPRVYHRQSFDKEEIDRIGYDPEVEVKKLRRLFWSCLFINDDIKRTGIDSAWEKVQEFASKAEPFFNFGVLLGYEIGEYQEALDGLMELIRANIKSSLALVSGFERKSKR